MALAKRRRRGSWYLLAVRGLGLFGLFAALLGVLVAKATPDFSFQNTSNQLQSDPASIITLLYDTPDRTLRISLWLMAVGVAAAVVALVVQLFSGFGRLAGRRSVTGSNAALQTALCVVLVVALNAFSFAHYQRFDWTGRQFARFGWRSPLEASHQFRPQFTLPADVIADLKQLRGETTVVVYQRHKTFGQLNDKPDAFDYAAERKVVEKVQDLVQLFREFGPQFRVVLLDVEDENYDKKLAELTDRNDEKKFPGNPALRKAIDLAPENSILFHFHREVPGPDGKPAVRESVQRLSFNDFYQLDKSSSRKQENLVLLPQGVESFARRVLAIEEKRPKVGIAVIHEYLTTEGYLYFTMGGVRKSLELYGFEVADVVLKKWGEGEPTPAAVTLGESKWERLEEELADSNANISILRQELQGIGAILEKLKSNITLEQLNQDLRQILGGKKMNEEARQINIARLEPQHDAMKDILAQLEKERNETLKQLEEIPGQERIGEYRRMNDVEAKLEKLLADVDLLILPRLTLRDVVSGDGVPARLHRLDAAQLAAVKAFMKAGKPVLAMFGPINEPPRERRMPMAQGPDNLETLFGQLGIFFGNQTVLFQKEMKAFSQRRVSLFATGTEVEIPPVYFEKPKPTRSRGDLVADRETQPAKPNPIAQSMKIVAAATGSADKLEKLKLRHPRPVYFVPLRGANSTAAEFLFSDPESWNESEPFPTREKSPRYDPPKPDDPLRGTRDQEQPGPFALGVAVETTVPADWMSPAPAIAQAGLLVGDAGAMPATTPYLLAAQDLLPDDHYAAPGKPIPLRVAAIGHGEVFNGPELSPAREQLLLHTCNWLLGRDERLPHAKEANWQFPRVRLESRRATLWQYGTLVALPAAFAFLGAGVLLVRKYR